MTSKNIERMKVGSGGGGVIQNKRIRDSNRDRKRQVQVQGQDGDMTVKETAIKKGRKGERERYRDRQADRQTNRETGPKTEAEAETERGNVTKKPGSKMAGGGTDVQ